jgi:hypothetical protein
MNTTEGLITRGGFSMKKTVYTILIVSLIIGLPLMILDTMNKDRDQFKIPSRFNKVVVDLSDKARTEELLFEKELQVPTKVEFIMQSDAEGVKNVKVISESEILGFKSREFNFPVGRYTGNSSTSATFIMDVGKYSVYLTSEKTNGKLAMGHQETSKEASEFERLLKIHNGDLDNPPDGYEEIFSMDLTAQSFKEEIIYTLSLDKAKEIGLSIYTSSKQGNVSVDLIGESASYFGLVHPDRNRICDQLETTLLPGEYQFKVTAENADGQLYVFIKQ